MVDLSTTNLLLGIMAGVSVLEALALIAAGIYAMRMYRRMREQIHQLEQHVQPVAQQASVVLRRLDRVAERIDTGTERVDAAVHATVQRVDTALGQVNGRVRQTADIVKGVVDGVRVAWQSFRSPDPPPRDNARRAGAPSDRVVPSPVVTTRTSATADASEPLTGPVGRS